ncbi:hypothetical protein AB6A40_009167 [Gnathostoma spinigerum]|uniref:Apple domain-containing protein n=1 Tax=Gnathostoma spinigerum TaxID=75299 RepID=A0ABD6ERJ1_9BILA
MALKISAPAIFQVYYKLEWWMMKRQGLTSQSRNIFVRDPEGPSYRILRPESESDNVLLQEGQLSSESSESLQEFAAVRGQHLDRIDQSKWVGEAREERPQSILTMPKASDSLVGSPLSLHGVRNNIPIDGKPHQINGYHDKSGRDSRKYFERPANYVGRSSRHSSEYSHAISDKYQTHTPSYLMRHFRAPQTLSEAQTSVQIPIAVKPDTASSTSTEQLIQALINERENSLSGTKTQVTLSLTPEDHGESSPRTLSRISGYSPKVVDDSTQLRISGSKTIRRSRTMNTPFSIPSLLKSHKKKDIHEIGIADGQSPSKTIYYDTNGARTADDRSLMIDDAPVVEWNADFPAEILVANENSNNLILKAIPSIKMVSMKRHDEEDIEEKPSERTSDACGFNRHDIWLSMQDSVFQARTIQKNYTTTSMDTCRKKCDAITKAGRDCPAFTFQGSTHQCITYTSNVALINTLTLKAAPHDDPTIATKIKFCFSDQLQTFANCGQFVALRDEFLDVVPREDFVGIPGGYPGLQACIELCVLSPHFHCKSATFFSDIGRCILNAENGLMRPNSLKKHNDQHRIYFENGCNRFRTQHILAPTALQLLRVENKPNVKSNDGRLGIRRSILLSNNVRQ